MSLCQERDQLRHSSQTHSVTHTVENRKTLVGFIKHMHHSVSGKTSIAGVLGGGGLGLAY